MVSKTAYVGLGVLVVVLIVAAVFLSKTLTSYTTTISTTVQGQTNSSSSRSVPIRLTDPPQVPAGTQALVIAYSSAQVHLSNANNQSGWVTAQGSGSIDLLSVVNLSQTIATVSLAANARVESIRFNITSATIKINGTTYNVTVPSGSVTAHITGGASVNASNSILIDFAPTIASIITANSTVYVMVPSLKAVIIGNGSNAASASVGARVSLSADERTELRHAGANITITGATISVAPNNVTHITITVKDNSNSSVILRGAGVMGNVSVRMNQSAINARVSQQINISLTRLKQFQAQYCSRLNSTVNSISQQINSSMHNASAHAQANANGSAGNSISISGHLNVNADVGTGFGIRLNTSICTAAGLANISSMMRGRLLNQSASVQVQQQHARGMVFVVWPSGMLSLPSNEQDFSANSTATGGYTLSAGQSVTLHFDGTMQTPQGFFRIALVPGASYKVGVVGSEGFAVMNNVTATSTSG